MSVAPTGTSRVVRFAYVAPVIARHTDGLGFGFGYRDAARITHRWLLLKQTLGDTFRSCVTFCAPRQAGDALLGIQRGRMDKEAQQARYQNAHGHPPLIPEMFAPQFVRVKAALRVASRALTRAVLLRSTDAWPGRRNGPFNRTEERFVYGLCASMADAPAPTMLTLPLARRSHKQLDALLAICFASGA